MSQKSKKNVYQANEKLELFDKKGKVEGILDKDDAVYVTKNIVVDGKNCIKFRVIKFWQTPDEFKEYTCEKQYFRPYEEIQSSVDNTDEDNQTAVAEDTPPKKIDNKNNYSVPVLTGLGFGTLSYFIAKKFGKNPLMYGLIGLAGGVALGYGLLKYHNKKV